MNSDDIIRMALDAGAMPVRGEPKQLAIVTNLMIERFAALVAAAEREAILSMEKDIALSPALFPSVKEWKAYKNGATAVFDAIRARGNGNGGEK